MITDVFCKIINKELAAEIVAEGDTWLAFKDINPQAPVHILIAPKQHFVFIEDKLLDKKEILGDLLMAVDQVARMVGISDNGYRVIINQKEHGGQMVLHFHIHILGGKKLGPKLVK